MKRYLALVMFLVLAVVLASPVSVLAKTKAGVKSGSFFYFFDKTFEKANLFFTFNPEKKAKKALENAEERLAEAEESASENKPEAVTEAMENYQKNIEVLEKVLNKVPEEAKEAIEKAIEASQKRPSVNDEKKSSATASSLSAFDKFKLKSINSKSSSSLSAFDKLKLKMTDKAGKTTVQGNTILCNGVYYTYCSVDTKFICPKTGEAYCETPLEKQPVSVSADTLICNGKEWLKCPTGHNFYCPTQGDAQCVPQPPISTNNQVNTSVTLNTSEADQTVGSLLQQEINKQNSWYEEYLRKQAEIDAMLKPIHEEENKITDQYMTECLQFITGKKASECDQLTLRLNSLEAEASRISGIYPERKTLPKVPAPKYEQWRIDKGLDGLSGTIWSPNSTIRYRWSCTNLYSCTLSNY